MIQFVVDDEMNVPVTASTDPKTDYASQNESDLEEEDMICQRKEEVECNTGRDIMSRFFNDWDEDKSGSLDIEEVLAGVEKCCDAMNIDYDSRRISALFEKNDADGSHTLDRQEFTLFLQRFADHSDIGMEDLAFVMADHLSQREYDPQVNKKESSDGRSDFFKALFSMVAFQMRRKEESTSDVDLKPAASPSRLAAFLNLFGSRPHERKGSTECEETIVELSADTPNFEDPKDDIQNMMWDVATD